MHRSLPLLIRAAAYGLRGGFLIRPFVIALALGAAGGALSSLEEHVPAVADWVPAMLFPSRQDPQVAQIILSAIATSIMTVVSIVFAILLMTMTLASTQFSPRILLGFVRDRSTQWTLGVFLGTFSYCMAALPAARSLPKPFMPVATVTGGMLLALLSWRIRLRVERGVGQFVPAGVPLLRMSHEDRMNPIREAELLASFDIGPTRTLQQDVEFGVLQIVDIALRAISPAVNDPSTAISCIDQLSRILIRWLGRAPPASVLFDAPHVPRVWVPWIGIDGMLNTAFEQIRHYAVTDVAVSLRLLRAIGDIAGTLRPGDMRASLLVRTRRVVDLCGEHLGEADAAPLRQRIAVLEARLGTDANRP